jgi:ribokinase
VEDATAGAGVLVIGSVNEDTTVRVRALPRPGETASAYGLATGLGGKGANQAVASAHAGAAVRLIAAVGDDVAGRRSRAELERHGVSAASLITAPSAPTGRAFITVDDGGENVIVVVPGANLTSGPLLTEEAVAAVGDDAAAVVLMQGEVPSSTIDAVARACADAGRRFVLNLAPVTEVAEATLRVADPLIVNATEAMDLFCLSEDRLGPAAIEEAIAGLVPGRAASLIVTLGGRGCAVATVDGVRVVPAERVETVVDTTGAGDAFCGTLAASLALGTQLDLAVERATAAAADAVRRYGAVPASLETSPPSAPSGQQAADGSRRL